MSLNPSNDPDPSLRAELTTPLVSAENAAPNSDHSRESSDLTHQTDREPSVPNEKQEHLLTVGLSVKDADIDSSGVKSVNELLVLICTFNEKLNLPELFDRIDAALPSAHVLVVDDNSPDGTGDWVREKSLHRPNTHLLPREGKQGLGTAIKAGMQYAIAEGYRWMVNLDADLSHDPAAIPLMIEKSPGYDLVIGSRYVDGGGMEGCSWRRVLVSKCANAYARFVVGWKVTDCSGSYRLYRVSQLAKLDWNSIQGKGYGFLEEVLWHLLNMPSRWTEVGIVYTERVKGQSKISINEALSAIDSLHRVARLKKRT